jgi:hypothetical protein
MRGETRSDAMDMRYEDAARNMLTPKENIVLKAGTVVKVGGFPFRLVADTPVEGHQGNLDLLRSASAQQGERIGG